MDLTYLGHSCFKLRGATGTLVTDPYPASVGFSLPSVSADIVTVSHHHDDHRATDGVKGTTRRRQPFVIEHPGEYELQQIAITGLPSYHDDQKGAERGSNTIMVIQLDGLRVAHLGDLGHLLSDKLLERLGRVDVLLIPVGGHFTIDPQTAVKVIHAVEPAIAIPMHFKTPLHAETFNQLAALGDFLKEIGREGLEPADKLTVSPSSLPQELEVVVLRR